MKQEDSTKKTLLSSDPLDLLELNTRVYNSLRRVYIKSIGELLQELMSGRVEKIPNIGPTSIAHIQDKLDQFEIINLDQEIDDEESDILKAECVSEDGTETQIQYIQTITNEVIVWMTDVINRQVNRDLLHKRARVAGYSIQHWTSVIDRVDRRELFQVMSNILGSSINVVDELEFILGKTSAYNLEVIVLRYGIKEITLQEIGDRYGVTRERIRQICNNIQPRIIRKIKQLFRLQDPKYLGNRPSLLRIQTSLLVAADMGLDICYQDWESQLLSSGLLGNWSRKQYLEIEPCDALIAITNLAARNKINELSIPNNLKYAIKLKQSGTPDIPAYVLHTVETLNKKHKKLIDRHTKFCGCVNSKWISEECEISIDQFSTILIALGYEEVTNYWFIPKSHNKKEEVGKYDVFDRSLRKMFHYCGPLSIDEVCEGMRHAVSRTEFPIPSPDVMSRILEDCGYSYGEDLYYWDGEYEGDLSNGEKIIFACMEQCGRVVHHTELAQSFIDSELSFPSLHKTLDSTPIIKKIDQGLYQLRGVEPVEYEIERAINAGERIPINPEIKYDTSGKIFVSLTIGVVPRGIGVVYSEQFPNLSGEWKCYVNGDLIGNVYFTENEFRGLTSPLDKLDIKPGDRVMFEFNTWDRSVSLKQVI